MNSALPENGSEFEKAIAYVRRQMARALKRAALRVEQYRARWIACQNWGVVHHQAELLQSNLYRLRKGMRTLTVADWEQEGQEIALSLDPLIEPAEQVKQLFRKSRKLRLGEGHLARQTAQAEELLHSFEVRQQQFEKIQSMDQLKEFCVQHDYALAKIHPVPQKKAPTPRLPYDQYLSAAGLAIWVGKSAKDNDRLTFQYANGSDYWLHVRDYPGSHVVLRSAEPDLESLRDAMELALRFSKCKGEGEVCITQVKFLKKIKGAAGKVMLSRQRIQLAVVDPARWERLKGRCPLTPPPKGRGPLDTH